MWRAQILQFKSERDDTRLFHQDMSAYSLTLLSRPSLHPIRGWQSETIVCPGQTLGLAYLLSGRLKHKRYNTNITIQK